MTINQLSELLDQARREQLDQGDTEVRVWLDEGAEENAGIRDAISNESGFALILDIE